MLPASFSMNRGPTRRRTYRRRIARTSIKTYLRLVPVRSKLALVDWPFGPWFLKAESKMPFRCDRKRSANVHRGAQLASRAEEMSRGKTLIGAKSTRFWVPRNSLHWLSIRAVP
jgi:hypothetical protein